MLGELRERLGRYLYSDDGRTIEEIVLELCRERGLTLATAESCTGGLVAARLTAVPGFSDVTLGGVVAYANEIKETELGVPAELIERARRRVGRGRRGDGGRRARAARRRRRDRGDGRRRPRRRQRGEAGRPRLFHAVTPDGSRGGTFSFPGDRDSIRRRAAVAALHLVRALLTQNRDEDA